MGEEAELNEFCETSSWETNSALEEEEFAYDANFLVTIGNKLFQKGRKLKPLIKAQPTKSLELVKDCRV